MDAELNALRMRILRLTDERDDLLRRISLLKHEAEMLRLEMGRRTCPFCHQRLPGRSRNKK